MGAKKKFPMTVKAGSTAIKIYKNPLTNSAGKKYDSYLVSYHRGGERVRTRHKSLTAAKDEAGRIAAKLKNEDLEALKLTGADRLAYVQASKIAKESGLTLDLMAKEYSAAKEKLGGVELAEAIRFYVQHGAKVDDRVSVPSLVERLIQESKDAKRSEKHINDLECRLRRFAKAFPGAIGDVTTDQIAEWVRKLKGVNHVGKEMEIGAKTRNHHRGAVMQLFRYAQGRNNLPQGIPTAADNVKPITEVPADNEILTPDELQTLLDHAAFTLLPSLAIKAFTGVRTAELMRLKWSDLNFETGYLSLTARITKTKKRRNVPIQDCLRKWLEPFSESKGNIARWSRPQGFTWAMQKLGRDCGIDVGANRLRNSYVSYRVALTQDIPKVSIESGNSPEIIQREYMELATKQQGEAWFNILPEEGRFNDYDPDGPEHRAKVRTAKKKKSS